MTFVPFTLLAVAITGAPPGAAELRSWRFVLPAPGESFEHPPFRALVLSRDKPEDLAEKVHYRGKHRRYAQVRFGSAGSIRVTIVLDEVGPGDVDLYVDANRDRKIDQRDRVSGTKESTGRDIQWRLPLDVAMVQGKETKATPRAVVFRLGATGRTLGYAATGYLEGTVTMAGQPRAARRMDGDGNGLLTDAQDRIWIDLDGDGRWDASAEQFLYATILNLDGARYVLRSDPLGTRLALEPLLGTGTVRLALKNAVAAELHATLVGRDGSAFGLTGDESAIVPIGEYRLGTVTATFSDPQGGQSWSFIFSDNGAKPNPKWYSLSKNGQLNLDPIGALEMELSITDKVKTAKTGEDIALQPLLFTGDGLLINVGYRGNPVSPSAQENLGAAITLATTDGQTLTTAHSGFA
jgi:hypothetical protein